MTEKPLSEKTISELRIEETLCYKLDADVYLPVKEELKNINKTYSLGMRKEDFKRTIESEIKKLKNWAIAIVKERRNKEEDFVYKEGFGEIPLSVIREGIINFLIEKFEIKEEDLK